MDEEKQPIKRTNREKKQGRMTWQKFLAEVQLLVEMKRLAETAG